MKIVRKPLGNEGVVFMPEGELDAYSGPQLRSDLNQAAGEGMKWFFVDLSSVGYIDSVGVGILVGAAKLAAAQQGDLAVVGPRPNVLRVFEVSGTSDLLNVSATLEEALVKVKLDEAGLKEGE